MAHADIHVLGSVNRYETVASSEGVDADERRELEVLSFGDATSVEVRDRLMTQAVINGRRLRSGRFAISRMLPAGGTDDAGRPTVEIVTLVLPEAGYRAAIRSVRFLSEEVGFWTAARAATASGIAVPDRPFAEGPVDQGVLRAFDLWFAARRSGAQGVLPESEGLTVMRLLSHLDPRDLVACRWGIGLLSLSPPADILTCASGTSLVGQRQVLKPLGPGQWHAPEMEYCQFLLQSRKRLPASDELTVTRVETPTHGETVVAHPRHGKKTKSSRRLIGLRIATGTSVVVAGMAVALTFFVTSRGLERGTDSAKGGGEVQTDADRKKNETETVSPPESSGEYDPYGGSLNGGSDGSVGGGTGGQTGDKASGTDAGTATGGGAQDGNAGGGTGGQTGDNTSGGDAGTATGGGAQDGNAGGGTGGQTGDNTSGGDAGTATGGGAQDGNAGGGSGGQAGEGTLGGGSANLPPDSDADGIPDSDDPCPEMQGQSAEDTDRDGVPNDCDACPEQSDPRVNGKQPDADGDGVGDECDNCPQHSNQKGDDGKQADEDKDGVGDACECGLDAQKDPNQRGMKGRDCDEDGKRLREDPPPNPPEPTITKRDFRNRAEALAEIDAMMKAWESPDRGKGTARECETIREALATLAGALNCLATELIDGCDATSLVSQKFVENGSRNDQKVAALQAIDERNARMDEFFRQSLTLLNNVCRKSPEACLEGGPIVKSGLDAAMVDLAEIAKTEFGKKRYRFVGNPAVPRGFLEDASGAVRTIGGYWAEFVLEAKRKIDPAVKRKDAINGAVDK